MISGVSKYWLQRCWYHQANLVRIDINVNISVNDIEDDVELLSIDNSPAKNNDNNISAGVIDMEKSANANNNNNINVDKINMAKSDHS